MLYQSSDSKRRCTETEYFAYCRLMSLFSPFLSYVHAGIQISVQYLYCS